MATTDTRAALERLYLEAYRAGVEAAGDTVGGSPRNTIWAARDRLVGTARQYLMDEGEWADSDSPLAQALALSAPEERGEGAIRTMLERCSEAIAAQPEGVFGESFAAATTPDGESGESRWSIRDELLNGINRALASPPAPVEGERGEIRDLSSEIHFADGMDDDVAPAPAVAQGAVIRVDRNGDGTLDGVVFRGGAYLEGMGDGEWCLTCGDLLVRIYPGGAHIEEPREYATAPMAQGAEERETQQLMRRQLTEAHRALDDMGAPTSGGPGRRRRYTVAGRIRALARPVAGSEERERIAQMFETYTEQIAGVFRRAVETATAKIRDEEVDAVRALEAALASEVEAVNELEADILAALRGEREG